MKALMSRFWREESGQTMTEYALMVALVAVFLIAIVVIFRNSISNVFGTAKDSLNAAP
jgi:Flp pilus assembly pilin Flp